MKLNASTFGTRLIAVLCVATALAVPACSNDKTGPASTSGATAITLAKTMNIPPGADPKVTAEMGGSGFEKIAADSGWQTTEMTPETFRYIADTNAKKGGSLSLQLSEFPATLRDYGKDGASETSQLISQMVHLPLLGINPLTLDHLPMLATHWKVALDSQTYYYRINPNARFHDGYPVTSEDVLATYKLLADSSILDPYNNSLMAEYDPPVAVSKYIVSIHSKVKNWKNLQYFGDVKILPAHEIGKMGGAEFIKKYQYQLPVGDGPYTVVADDIKKQQELSITRVEDWWGTNEWYNRGQYNFNKIRIVCVTDDRLRLEKFKKGDVDLYIVNRAQWWIEEFKDDPIQRGVMLKRRVYTDEPQSVTGIAFNTRKPPFDDQRVRLAFVHLFHREQLLDKLMYNQYTIMDTYYPNSVFVHPNNPQFRYDPAKAMELLTQAGYTSKNAQGVLMKDGHPLEFDMLVTDQSFERLITPVQQDMMKYGVKMNLRNVNAVTAFQMATDRNFTVKEQSWTGTVFPNPDNIWSSKLADVKNTNNLTGFKNARVDELIAMEKTSFDPARRVWINQQIDSVLMESNHYALMWYAPYSRIVYWNFFDHPDFYMSKVGDWKDCLQYWWDNPELRKKCTDGRTDKGIKLDSGATDVKFWPDFDKQYPNGLPQPSKSSGGSEKPSIK